MQNSDLNLLFVVSVSMLHAYCVQYQNLVSFFHAQEALIFCYGVADIFS